MRPVVAVIGGGISGLAAANRIKELSPEINVRLFESEQRLGGVLGTVQVNGFLVESAADSFLTTPESAGALCRRVGLAHDLIETRKDSRRASVVSKSMLRPVPEGFLTMAPSRIGPILTTPILTPVAKLRLMLEWFIPRSRTNQDESLAHFATRRFGREVYQKLIQPLAAGIYSADPELLSVAATMPRFLQMEQQSGSVIRAMMQAHGRTSDRGESAARYGQFISLKRGMESLVTAVSSRLSSDSIHLGSQVRRIIPMPRNRWRLFSEGQTASSMDVDAVIVATPASHAAQILTSAIPPVVEDLRQMGGSSCAVVALAYQTGQIQRPLDGFGFVVPLIERRQILSCSFSSIKYEGRAPAGYELFRIFMGGECQPEVLQLSDDELLEIARRELSALLQIRGNPALTHVIRHSRVMPQYHVGHLDRVARMEKLLSRFPTVKLIGSSLKGGGIPGCVANGESAAQDIVAALAKIDGTELGSTQCSITQNKEVLL